MTKGPSRIRNLGVGVKGQGGVNPKKHVSRGWEKRAKNMFFVNNSKTKRGIETGFAGGRRTGKGAPFHKNGIRIGRGTYVTVTSEEAILALFHRFSN